MSEQNNKREKFPKQIKLDGLWLDGKTIHISQINFNSGVGPTLKKKYY